MLELTVAWLCLQELAAIRDALTPPLACAAAKIGDIDTLEALKEMVGLLAVCTVSTFSEKRRINTKRKLQSVFIELKRN